MLAVESTVNVSTVISISGTVIGYIIFARF